ncbi:MAG: glycoside hydrolase family 5 protein [Acetatifactor sp.]|nr:glycoside hydrolase family 5 protein [Acetatifactor sp.]
MLNKMKRFMAGFVGAAAIGLLVAGAFPMEANAAGEKLTGKTAMEITQMMGKGWNLGNTFDANGGNRSDVYSQETSWGNPKVTKELIDGVKAAGFDTIRIPVTWYKHIEKGDDYKIDEPFMARVKEVVDYAFDNDLYVILNVHHENWVNDKNIDKNYKEIGKELVAVWEQIADTFADYDQHLIFEGMNEPRAQGTSYEWTGNQECYDAINYLNQCFVTTIRKNGKGQNGERALMIPGYAASNSGTVLKSIVLPEVNGKQDENLIISVHCYSPYNFCLSDAQDTFSPTNPSDTSDITTMMSTLKTLFLNNGVPVVIGECGATNSHDNDGARKAWFMYMGEITANAGVPAVVWDNGAKGKSGGECHNYFVRKTGEMAYPELISAFIYGDLEAKKPKDMVIDFEPYQEDGVTIMASPEQYGFTPKTLGKMLRINHTPGAKVGFSAQITAAEKYATTMDLSKFGGKRINVSFYLQSKSSDTVTIGMNDAGTATDIVTADIDGDWTAVTFSYKFSEGEAERAMTFQGADDFYLDDITITMVEDADAVETFVGKEADAPVVEKPAEESKETVASSSEGKEESSTAPQPTVTPEKKTSVIPFVIIGGIVVVLAAVILVLRKKKAAGK